MTAVQHWAAHYSGILETLAPVQLDKLAAATAEDIEFQDPFNHTTTQADFLAVMADMFERLDWVRFDVHSQQQNGQEAFITWTFSAASGKTGEFSVAGSSYLTANSDGLVTLHRDYWDASELMQMLPLLGAVIRKVRRTMGHG